MAKAREKWRTAMLASQAIGRLSSLQHLEEHDIEQLQSITNSLLEQHSPSIFSRRGIEPQSQKCDDILREQIASLSPPLRAVSVLASLHALSAQEARNNVFDIKPPTYAPSELCTYFECISRGFDIRPEVFTRAEAVAASAATNIVSAAHSERAAQHLYTSVWALLNEVCCESMVQTELNLFPDELVLSVLSSVEASLQDDLLSLRDDMHWMEAYRKVEGLRGACSRPRAAAFLQRVLPQFQMWAAWTPNVKRIGLWSELAKLGLAEFRPRLKRLFLLEGPDLASLENGNYRGTLRASTATWYFDQLLQPDDTGDFTKPKMLERLLIWLDCAILIGPSSVRLFISMTMEVNRIDRRLFLRLEEALRLKDERSSETLAGLLSLVQGGEPKVTTASMAALSSALPLVGKSRYMRTRWGDDFDITRLAAQLLCRAQVKLCREILPRRRISQHRSFASAIQALGEVMWNESWMHRDWSSEFLQSLRRLPAGPAVHDALEKLSAALGAEENHNILAFLAHGFCPVPEQNVMRPRGACADIESRHTGGLSPRRSLRDSHRIRLSSYDRGYCFDDEIWHSGDLKPSHSEFRHRLRLLGDVPPALATRCLRQGLDEKDFHIKEFSEWLFRVTHQGSIRISEVLAKLMAKDRFKDHCWADLLLFVVRKLDGERSPKTILDHFLDEPDTDSERLTSWVQSLRQVFGPRFADVRGELGLTESRIQECTTELRARQGQTVGAGRQPARHVGLGSSVGDDDLASSMHALPAATSPTSPASSDLYTPSVLDSPVEDSRSSYTSYFDITGQSSSGISDPMADLESLDKRRRRGSNDSSSAVESLVDSMDEN